MVDREEKLAHAGNGEKGFCVEMVMAPLCVLAALFVMAMFTGLWPNQSNQYRTYALQACAWLEGRLDLGQDYPWLELAIYEGRYYVSFPPFPSYVLLPFAAVCGVNTPDHWISLVTTLIGVFYAVRLYRLAAGTRRNLTFFVLFLYLSNGYLFIGMQGYVWFIAQTMCFTLSLMALTYAAEGKGGLSLTCWACAVGCRPMVVLYLPLLAYMIVSKRRAMGEGGVLAQVRRHWYWAIGPLVLAASYMTLNYLRFGSVIEFGHSYLPEFMRTPEGQFDLSYLAGNLSNLLRLPEAGENGKLSFYKFDTMAFYLIDPILVAGLAAVAYAAVKKRRGNGAILVMTPVLAIAYVLILCMHKTLGGWQFGNRYLLDLLPYLFYGMLVLKPEGEGFAKACAPLMVLGAVINLLGSVATYNSWI